MSLVKIDYGELIRLQKAMQDYHGSVEEALNEVLHSEGGQLLHDEIKRLMPRSERNWRGKKKEAKTANSLFIGKQNLTVVVKAKIGYDYLYFPNDGTNTYKHAGRQFFFEEAGKSQKEEIVNRCIKKLVNNFNDAIN